MMWVLTENGDLVNLDQVKRIGIPWRPDLDRNPRTEVKAWEAHYDAFGVTLCTCDDEEHGKRIVAELAGRIAREEIVVNMKAVKDFVKDMMRRDELARNFGSGA